MKHRWIGAAELDLNDETAERAQRTEQVTIRTVRQVRVIEVLCSRCRLPFWRVAAVECEGAPRGGPRREPKQEVL